MKGTKRDNQQSLFLNEDLEAQRQYARRMVDSGYEFNLMVADAFVRGIRDLGYKSTATALNELIDNSIQAQAENIHVIYDYEGNSSKPVRVAVVDDGHGMDPDMIRLSIAWGGTHRENDRLGFGRYGYGLPSACVSQGRRFEVFSKVESGSLHMSWLDLDEIGELKHRAADGGILIPGPIPVALPPWLKAELAQLYDGVGWQHGTIVVLDKLDRLDWTTRSHLTRNLQENFGVVYRNFLRQVNISVDHGRVEPLDPLFTTPGYRFHDLDNDRAEALPGKIIPVKDKDRGLIGELRVRFSYMPPTFARIDKTSKAVGRNQNSRWHVLASHNGIIVCRNGRQIDVVTKSSHDAVPFSVLNNDRYWGVEIDFPATLDEEFSVTTSKQRVILSNRIWQLLREHGVMNAIGEMRQRYRKEEDALEHEMDKKIGDEDSQRPSEAAMQDAEKYKIKRPGQASTSKEAEKRQQLREEAENRARKSGRSVEEEEQKLVREAVERPYKVMLESHPDAPFYRMSQIGGQQVLYLNTAHAFFTYLYSGRDSSPRIRATLEVLLFVIGGCELDATDERRSFYRTERVEWSVRLSNALLELPKYVAIRREDDSGGDEEDSGQAVVETEAISII